MSLGLWVSLCFPSSFRFVKKFCIKAKACSVGDRQLCLVTSGFILGSAPLLTEMETRVPLRLATRLLKQWFPRKWSFLRSLKLENEKGQRLEELVSLNKRVQTALKICQKPLQKGLELRQCY